MLDIKPEDFVLHVANLSYNTIILSLIYSLYKWCRYHCPSIEWSHGK